MYLGTPSVEQPRQSDAVYHSRRRRRRQPTTELSIAAIGDVDNLAAVFEKMKAENGRAAGPDRLTYKIVGRSELYAVLRPISKAILDGNYRPGAARQVNIPKGGDRGFRTLTLRSICDRVVAKAVNEAVSPFFESIFLDGSHGFRPQRSTKTLLAQLQRVIVEQDRWVLVSDDITKAFDSVDLGLVLADHARYSRINEQLLRLIAVILHGGDDTRTVGMDQGSPYSPLAMNIHLHNVLDQHAQAMGGVPGQLTPWWRYADNLLVACHDVREGKQALIEMTNRLAAAGLTLKGENNGEPIDLKRTGQPEILGLVLSREGSRIRFEIGKSTWSHLEQSLLAAHASDQPVATAVAVLAGWIDAISPTLDRRNDRIVSAMRDMACRMGLHESPTTDQLASLCRAAHDRWLAIIAAA